MSLELFALAMKKINDSEMTGAIFLEAGPMVDEVERLGVVKKTPTLAYVFTASNQYFYFQKKDLIGFTVEDDVGEHNDEETDDRD